MAKRSLVDYDDEPEADICTGHGSQTTPLDRAIKRRRLTLPCSALLPSAPVDDPSQHQGRMRTIPHSDGQFVAYVYFPLQFSPGSACITLLSDALRMVSQMSPDRVYRVPSNELLSSLSLEGDRSAPCLHVSLTHPISLRAHQRREFERAVGMAAQLAARFFHPDYRPPGLIPLKLLHSASRSRFPNSPSSATTRVLDHFLPLKLGPGTPRCRQSAKHSVPFWPPYDRDLIMIFHGFTPLLHGHLLVHLKDQKAAILFYSP
jgi:hypothetical protein